MPCILFSFKGNFLSIVRIKRHLFRSFQQKIEAWREMLEYFIFDKWQVAVNVLSNGFDTYSCYRWPPRNYTMYSGSFWWSTSAYIRKLPDFQSDIISSNRFYSEVWLFERKPSTIFSFRYHCRPIFLCVFHVLFMPKEHLLL